MMAHPSHHAAPARDVGEGPFDRLILRDVTVVDGTGAPAYGPADIVIDGDRITQIFLTGPPTGPRLQGLERPEPGPRGRELALAGHYVLPGFVDAHGHIGWPSIAPGAQYVYDLWLGHGITTVREPGCFINGLEFVADEAARAERGEIAAPRIHPYAGFGLGRTVPFTTPDEARAWVGEAAAAGATGLKLWGYRRDIFAATIAEAAALGLGTACHHQQSYVAQATALDSARWGLSSIEHWYGIPEALFTDRTVQHFPSGYDYEHEVSRFTESGRLWRQAAEPGSPRWDAGLDEFLATGVTLDPTFNVYQGLRDATRVRTHEWHAEYTAPRTWDHWQPGSGGHGSFFSDWGSEQEVAWKENFRLWMAFVKQFHARGGRVTVGTDPGSIFSLWGFNFVEELQLLREVGLHPLEVLRAATLAGAELLGEAHRLGSIEAGKLADLVVLSEDPVANLKTLAGHGHVRVTGDRAGRVGGAVHTIKGGIVYDARALLDRVRATVCEEREAGLTRT
jgi:amidohydrolase family protein